MGRSGYSDDGEYESNWDEIMAAGQLQAAIRGKRGQKFLGDLVEALDALPEKRLIAEELRSSEGVCALGCVGVSRGLNLEGLDSWQHDKMADIFDISLTLVRQVEWLNDDDCFWQTPEQRWQSVRKWAVSHVRQSKS
jgi:hypothetical protein